MTPAATRSRLLQLKGQSAAARRARQLLEEKREALIRAVAQARLRRDAARARASAALASARWLLGQAQVELGVDAVDAAGLAQAQSARITVTTRSILGVIQPVLSGAFDSFQIRYGPGGTSRALDRAAAAFAEAVPLAAALAQEELALGSLRSGLEQTSRRANALEQLILPRLELEIRRVESALEEEARDEAARTRGRARISARRGAVPGSLSSNRFSA